MRKIGIPLLYISSILMFIGGLGDQFIFSFLDVHLKYLGNPENSELLQKAQSLAMFMLHSAGGGLMSAGISMFALTHFGIRNEQSWAAWTFIIIAFIAQGFNGYGMYSAGSHYWYPILVLAFALIGFGLVKTRSRNE
ncbi:MAG: hypothetical protein R8N23_08925 [Reichenbachiella sp.]|uniref:hypothetical protein n=1 Tax=Reichenbachiella sp. TaxID=2184521 RepID=UPI002965D840|nr:hypothetical protein [Reichenbachiella sp.]MDW3209977.1 hypothetical protein [Reichenbachiella sp.]